MFEDEGKFAYMTINGKEYEINDARLLNSLPPFTESDAGYLKNKKPYPDDLEGSNDTARFAIEVLNDDDIVTWKWEDRTK